MVWTASPEGEGVDVLHGWEKLSGQSAEESRGAGWIEKLHPDDQERTGQAWQRAIALRTLYDTEFRFRARNGEWRSVVARAVPVLEADGTVREWVGTLADVTERKQAEAAKAESLQRLADVLERTTDGFLALDKESRFTHVNARFAELTGRRAADLLGKPVWAEFPEGVDKPFQRAFERAMAEQVPITVEACYEPWDRWFECRIHPAPEGISVFVQDVTERRLAVQVLKDSEERYRLVARATNDAIWDWDLVTDEVRWNEGVTVLFGYPSHDIGRDAGWRMDRIHGEDRDRVVAGLHAVIEGSGATWSAEYRFLRRDSSHAHVIDRGYVVRDGGGRALRMIGAMTDLTARRRTEQERDVLLALANERRTQIEGLSRRLVNLQEAERREIARELHDDLGQLLTGLKLLIEAAGSPDEARRREMKRLVQEVLGRVRDLSMSLRPAMLDDLGLVPALLWHFERFTQQSGIRVDFRHEGLAERQPVEVETAAFRIVQEALTNVARHSGAAQASVAVTAEAGRLQACIEDRGQGFDVAEALSKRSSGLWSMRERATLLGGRVVIESSSSRGTRLTAEFPVAVATEGKVST